MNTATQFLLAAYGLGLGLVLAQALSLWAQLSRTRDAGDEDGGRS